MSTSDPFAGMTVPSAYLPGVSFQFQRRLGEGGTAMAYLALRCTAEGESPVVIKVILPRLVAESDAKANTIIMKEAVALGRLNERVPPTPFVVRFIDTGVGPDRAARAAARLPWIALEYVHGGVEGTSLEERVAYSVYETGFAFDPERAARALLSLASGLSAIHAVGVIHRDLHPGNVLCCGFGEVGDVQDHRLRHRAAGRAGGDLRRRPGRHAGLRRARADHVALSAGRPRHRHLQPRAIVFFVLTGEHYFDDNPGRAASAIQSPERRSIRATRRRCRPSSASAIARARRSIWRSRARPRPIRSNARRRADCSPTALVPWLSADAADDASPAARRVSAMKAARDQVSAWSTGRCATRRATSGSCAARPGTRRATASPRPRAASRSGTARAGPRRRPRACPSRRDPLRAPPRRRPLAGRRRLRAARRLLARRRARAVQRAGRSVSFLDATGRLRRHRGRGRSGPHRPAATLHLHRQTLAQAAPGVAGGDRQLDRAHRRRDLARGRTFGRRRARSPRATGRCAGSSSASICRPGARCSRAPDVPNATWRAPSAATAWCSGSTAGDQHGDRDWPTARSGGGGDRHPRRGVGGRAAGTSGCAAPAVNGNACGSTARGRRRSSA